MRKASKDLKTQNTVVLSGLELKEANSADASGEIDFLLISWPLKSIIHIEAKKGNNHSNRRKASAQLKRGQAFFKENVPFPTSEKWNYIKMMCFGESVETDIYDRCKHFVLSANFIETNKTQTVSKPIADQLKTFWRGCKAYKGRSNFKMQFLLYLAAAFKYFKVTIEKKVTLCHQIKQWLLAPNLQDSHKFGEASHIFLKNGLWQMSASLVSSCNTAW